jgi:C1A family cysteine protease
LQQQSFAMPLAFDWRTHGAVTTPRAQGSCGGCYCFAGVASLEYWYHKKTGTLKDFSVQQCLDCTHQYIPDSDGCDGGLMEDLYELTKRRPLGFDSADRYRRHDSACVHSGHGIKVKSYHSIDDEFGGHAEQQLASNLVQYGPIPVGIDSRSLNMELYRDGIIRASHCTREIDHAVTVVGYNTTGTTRYWIVKNSWGKHWGQEGYFYLERDANACGIDSYASFVTDAALV